MKKLLSIFVLLFFTIQISFAADFAPSSPLKADRVVLGDEQFESYLPLLKDKRVALFSNHSGIVGDKIILSDGTVQYGGFSEPESDLIPFGKDAFGKDVTYGEHILDALLAKGVDVTAIFCPEHGFRGTEDAGSKIASSVDEKTGIPILSLYGNGSHSPSATDLAKFDTLVIDIQDVGLRFYTYYISIFYLIDACSKNNKNVILLDRPNPNGFLVDGGILKSEFESGVGKFPIPTSHGMTLGELFRMGNGEGWFSLGKNSVDLTVIPCRNYSHETKYSLVRRPSPNLKDMRAVYLYPSICFFENTVVSVGRGTEFPFEVFGSPKIAADATSSSGADFSFTPQSMDGAKNPPFLGQTCYGLDLRKIPLSKIWKEGIDLSYLKFALEKAGSKDFFGAPDKNGRYWIDYLSGSDRLRKELLTGNSASKIKKDWQEGLDEFKKMRKSYLLYSEQDFFNPCQVDLEFPNWNSNQNYSANNLVSFKSYKGQGEIYVTLFENCASFSLYVNNVAVSTKGMKAGSTYRIDISKYTKNGLNTLQVSDVKFADDNKAGDKAGAGEIAAGAQKSGPQNAVNKAVNKAVRVQIPFPVLKQGTIKDVGIGQDAISLIDKIISSDIKNGFTSAQLAIVKDGVLAYQNSWGNIQTYGADGQLLAKSAPKVTNDTLYDLASVSKMFGANLAVQYLVSQNLLSLNTKIVDILGDEFADKTISVEFKFRQNFPLSQIKEWKRNITVKDVLNHTAGFPSAYPYFNDNCDISNGALNTGTNNNPLFSGSDASERTRENTFNQLCRSPLVYEPGTKVTYSDVDFILLGFIVEKVSGRRLDDFMKANFYQTLDLEHVTYRPLENGFSKTDCVATDLAGNSYSHLLKHGGIRTDVIQGHVHDQNSYYAMAEVSGHAGLFATATDLSKLAFLMLSLGNGNHHFFNQNVVDSFTSPQNPLTSDYALGWWRQAQNQTMRHFGTVCSSRTIGHSGFTGTAVFVEPEQNLIIIYLTNKISTPMVKGSEFMNQYVGNFYQSANAGFIPQIIMMSLNGNTSKAQWKSLVHDMSESARLKAESESPDNQDDFRWKAFNSLKNVENDL
ncbi:MAG: DUF1343 domain-containing protein [Treponemataceae bacterium]|nr:DUF1343 domain-containing protein [Treponemataceae bacterium]